MKRSKAPGVKLGCVAVAVFSVLTGSAIAAEAKSIATDRIIVKYRDTASVQSLGANAASVQATRQAERLSRVQTVTTRFGASVQFLRNTGLGSQVWKLDRSRNLTDVAAMAAQIKASDPNVEYAEPDRIMHPLAAAPNDTRWSEQWDLQNTTAGLNVLAAWDLSTGSGVNVAVIDTGYRPHADLAANVVGGYDMINDTAVSNDGNGRDSDARDPGDYTAANECQQGDPAYGSSWHGTHVAGTIAAVTNNGTGVAGIAPNAKIVPMRVLGKCGGYTSDIADAMIWASGGTVSGLPTNPNKARVLNLSLGGGGACDTTSQNAINAARANGAVVIVAAGNESQNVSNSSPANCSGVVAVAAYGKTGARAYYSNYGTLVDIAGPGGDQSTGDSNGILSTLNAGGTTPGADSYAYYQGTSMATPHVAGVAALMIAAKPTLTPDQVESLLKSSARPFVASCSGCGAGMLDAYAAVQAAIGGTTPTPTTSETESNNTLATANAVAAAGTLNATIGSTSDTDYFKVSLPAGKTLTATMTPGKSSVDYDLYLYNASGTQVAKSELGAGKVDTASVKNTGSATATYYARVVYYSGGTGATNGKYTLGLAW
ncbi:S8 family peptidase [Chitinimonas koreensis]|uniref:S8 family peptidase n=1 Tax=Chitinimonas koreensis TaxID=356302 RepID=UPI00048B8D5D|nr:S8 family peptidase [Chitinimonas koreensis]QNM97337.1 S8 family serine peptidase [Chitinimonas koreensis]